MIEHGAKWSVLVCVSLLLFVGCASNHPKDLIQRNDHSGMKAWYMVKAGIAQGKAEEMRHMAAEYRRQETLSGSPPKLSLHCETLVERYTEAATAAENMAKYHAEHPLSSQGSTQPPSGLRLFSF